MGQLVKTSHRPNVKYTAQELGGDLCDIFKYLSLLYSKSVKNDCELPHLLGDFVPDPLTVLGSVHHGWLSVVQTPSAIYSPQITISGITKKWTWWCEIFLLLLSSYSPHPWSHISFSSCTGIRNHIYSFYKLLWAALHRETNNTDTSFAIRKMRKCTEKLVAPDISY